MSDEQSWTSKKYNEYYTAYVPWLEDKYLAWFGENKTSYTTKGASSSSQPLTLHFPPQSYLSATSSVLSSTNLLFSSEQLRKTKVTGNEGVDNLQEGVIGGVGGQLDSKGLLGAVGDTSSKEGVNRAERGDTGPLNPAEAKKAQKGWGESGSNILSFAGVMLLLTLV